MTFYIVTMVGRGPQSARALGPYRSSHPPFLSPPLPVPGQVVMTIIVAFILEAFVFRMNYSRKNQDSEGQCECLPLVCLSVQLSAFQLSGCPVFWQFSLSVWLIFLDLLFALFSNT